MVLQRPQYGYRLMPQVLEDIATHRDRTFAINFLPDSQGHQEIKFSAVSRAVDWLAYHLQNVLGKGSQVHETVAYLGLSDLRYTIVFLAVVKCGYKVLLPSPRNTTLTNGLLFDSTECSKLLYSPELDSKVKELQATQPSLTAFPIPSLTELLEKNSDPFPYLGSYDERKWEPILVLHSSGSTGAPKPIIMNHATFAVADHDRLLATVPGRTTQNYAMWDFPNGGSFYSPFPPFHLAGFTAMTVLPIYAESTSIVLGPADRPPAIDLAVNIMKTVPIKALFCPPSIAEGIACDPGALECARNLQFLLYAGGPLSEAAGSNLSKVTDVCQFYGQTETGLVQSLLPRRSDWAWLEWHPAQGVTMQAYTDDLFEMVMHRNPALEKIRSLSCNFPDEEVWHTKDLFRKHAARELWQFAGRVDDIIVLSSGEKYNPVPAEVFLGGVAGIKGALIVGHGRFSPALLLELNTNASDKTVADIWPDIDTTNSKMPGYGKIRRSLVFITNSDKPFERAAKGTIIRASTERLLRPEIDKLYSQQLIETTDVPQMTRPITFEIIQSAVTECISCISNQKQVDQHVDLFASGFDSLQALELASLLKHSLRLTFPMDDMTWLSSVFIYQNPTQSRLTQTLWDRLHPIQENQKSVNRAKNLVSLATRETLLIDQMHPGSKHETNPLTKAVVLTGATGSLGRHILQTLVLDITIRRVYCLIRSTRSKDRLLDDLEDLPGTDKVAFLQFDLADSRLGLSFDDYNLVAKTTTTVIHAAWLVDFNQELSSFDIPFITSMKYLFQLLLGKKDAHFVFISSLSTVSHWSDIGLGNTVPESIHSDARVPASTGYAGSKYIAEWLCQHISDVHNVRTSVLRIGQIAGPLEECGLRTTWKDTEWVPLMLKTSKSLRKIPHDLPPVDWLPVDVVANIVHDIVKSLDLVGSSYCSNLNVVNPGIVQFKNLLPSIQSAFGPGLREVDLQTWLETLEKIDQESHENLEAFPAFKILEFFRSLLNKDPLYYKFDTLRKISATFREVKPIDGTSLARWVQDMAL